MTRGGTRVLVAGVVVLGATLWLGAAGTLAADGPVAHWRFDEVSGSIADDAAGTHDGSIDGVTFIADGFDAGAFRFDGGAVTIQPTQVLRSADMALSLWVRGDPQAPPAAGQVIVDNGDVLCGGSGYALVVTEEYAKVVFRDAIAGAGIRNIEPSAQIILSSLWDGAWHHVAVSASGGEWGWVSLYIDGWHVAFTSSHVDSSHGIDFGTGPTAPLLLGGDDSCGPGFVGDLDDIQFYDRIVGREELAALEPPIATMLEIDTIEEPATVNIYDTDWFDIDVTLLPAPAKPGTFWVYVTGEDGVERPRLRRDVGLGDLTTDGRYGLAFNTDYGGTSTIRVEFEALAPALSSEDSRQVEIGKAPSSTRVRFSAIDTADDPIWVGVSVDTTGRVQVTGEVELWEVTDGPALIGTADLLDGDGTLRGGASFLLPPRPAGEYLFEAKYFGSAANQPSASLTETLTVLPGLDTGEVIINNGAATTDNPIVEVSAPATGAIGWLITTDPTDIRRQFQLPYSETFTTWLTAPWYGDDADGVRTIWVKWADAKSRWTDWSTASIVLERPPAGATLIDDGADYTGQHDVTVSVPIADPTDVQAVELSNDGLAWTAFGYAESIPWSLSAGVGSKSVRARWVHTDGKASASVGDTIVVDGTPPIAAGLANTFAVGATIEGGKVPIRLTWTATDATSGVARFELARSKDGSSFKSIATSLTTTSVLKRLEPGHSYRFRVRAVDRAGNVGAWTYGRSFRLSAAQESSRRISYVGSWRTAASAAYWGGRSRYTKAGGAKATIAVKTRSFAWVSAVGPTRGTARIYVNGNLVATVDLHATSTSARRVVFSKTWAATRIRTIVIRVSGTIGHPRVDLDGILWAR